MNRLYLELWGRTKRDVRIPRIQVENRAILWAYNDVFEIEKGGLRDFGFQAVRDGPS
jgi:hypothetical protein